jgi:hypothetical protein
MPRRAQSALSYLMDADHRRVLAVLRYLESWSPARQLKG